MLRTLPGKLQAFESFDPVLLLRDLHDWSSVDLADWHLPEKYILLNVPPERCPRRWVDRFVSIARRDGHHVLCLPNPQGAPVWEGLPHLFPIGPEQWYRVIQKARGYVGVRFHPVVVALANRVPFVSMDEYGLSPLAALGLNYLSKTFDLCQKARRSDLVIKSRFFALHSPAAIYARLRGQDPDSSAFVSRAQAVFLEHLDRILKLADNGATTSRLASESARGRS
jgi:hypothetical protein